LPQLRIAPSGLIEQVPQSEFATKQLIDPVGKSFWPFDAGTVKLPGLKKWLDQRPAVQRKPLCRSRLFQIF
jgi:hypothetical protein